MSVERSEHPFDAAVRVVALGGDRFAGHITPAYANMVGPFGGMIAAVLLNAVLSHASRQGDPVGLTVNFAAPITDDGFVVTARPVRTSRSTQHWMVELEQAGKIAATATAFLALRRPTWECTEALAPAAAAPATLAALPKGAFTPWINNYEMRFAHGALKLDGVEQDDSVSTLWVRDEPSRPLDFLSLAAMSDCFFPRHMTRRQRHTPGGTVSLTTYFHADAAAVTRQGAEPLLATAHASRFHATYYDQTAQLWGVDNTLLVVTHQLVYYRD
ncbi:MAG TPA: thioesterase family protein [Nevskiaceae bacterium]|nr:thioesterase family protein [Nevskiaceae bacterium]